jgi:hypothetical protein
MTAKPGSNPNRRARLARKAEVLYAKSCGTNGDCAEGFAVHQLQIGNAEVVADFLRFLEGRLAQLETDDPDGLRAMTEGLIARIRGLTPGGRS